MLTVEQVHNAVQQKIALLSDRAWERYDREGIDFTECEPDFCAYTRLHAMDKLLRYRSGDLTYHQLEEFYAAALQAGGYSEVPFLPFDFIFLDIPVYQQPEPGTAPSIELPIDAGDVLYSIVGATETYGSFKPGDWSGTVRQLLDLFLKKYQLPSFASFSHNKPTVLEVGQSVSGSITFSWGINNPQNVKDAPDSGFLTTSENDVITPAGAFNLFGTTGKTVNFISPYVKNTVGTLYFYLNGTNTENSAMAQVSTSIHWNTRIMAGNAVDPSVSIPQVEGFTPIAASSRNVSGTIVGAGYKYIFVPDMLNQNGIKFIDPVNGNIDIDMEAPVAMTITNAQGISIAGQLYRTTNSLGSNLTFNIV